MLKSIRFNHYICDQYFKAIFPNRDEKNIYRFLISITVCAKWAAPPSGRSVNNREYAVVATYNFETRIPIYH